MCINLAEIAAISSYQRIVVFVYISVYFVLLTNNVKRNAFALVNIRQGTAFKSTYIRDAGSCRIGVAEMQSWNRVFWSLWHFTRTLCTIWCKFHLEVNSLNETYLCRMKTKFVFVYIIILWMSFYLNFVCCKMDYWRNCQIFGSSYISKLKFISFI